jgi:MFS family permease
MIISIVGVIMGAIFLFLTLSTPLENKMQFGILLSFAALFMPFSSPNVISTVYDITLPEIRSTAFSIQMFIESGGAALAPLLAGIIADNSSLRLSILVISIIAWILCATFYIMAALIVPQDISVLRSQLQERASLEQQYQVHVG